MKQVDIRLQPKQMEYGQLMYKTGPEAATWLGFGGARAGGKSGGLRRIMLDRRLQRPNTKGAIIRRVYDEVKRNHIDKYFEEFPELRPGYRVGDKEIQLPNGSTIVFAYAENQQEVDRKFWGVEYYDIFVDQAEQFNERELTIIKSCNRWPGAPINDCKTGLFFNPGGVGTEFLRRVFYQHRFMNKERANDYKFIHVFGWDNYVWFEPLGISPQELYAMSNEERFELFISQTTEGRKLDAMPPSLRAGHLLGSFDSFAGQYFAGVWDESKLILTARQEENLVQPWWTRWMAHDDGFVHHACVLWAVSGKVSPKNFNEIFGLRMDATTQQIEYRELITEPVTVVVVYRNLTEAETEAGELIRMARENMTLDEYKTLTRYFLSVDAWEKDSKGHSVADTIAEECRRPAKIQVGSREVLATLPYPEQADNARIGGWRFLYAMMKKTADVLEGKMNPTRVVEDYETEAGGYSKETPLLFISGRCNDVIEAVPMAIRDDRHVGRHEDVLKQPTKGDDVIDTLRYLCKSMLNPKTEVPLPVRAKEVWNEMGDLSTTEKAIMMRRLEVESKRTTTRRSSWAR